LVLHGLRHRAALNSRTNSRLRGARSPEYLVSLRTSSRSGPLRALVLLRDHGTTTITSFEGSRDTSSFDDVISGADDGLTE
jgi:hypothetical protein